MSYENKSNLFFITVDAETDLIKEGTKVISDIRDEIENKENINIPIVWLIRFQRDWSYYIDNDSTKSFKDSFDGGFDGLGLSKKQLLEYVNRGDEVGWHYHAYNYVHRGDLSHSRRMQILRADLISCSNEINTRHPEFDIQSFRFGWFFIPDYKIYSTLKKIGIKADASINPQLTGRVNAKHEAVYISPITCNIEYINGIKYFPFFKTLLIHDWNLVPHEFGWHNLTKKEAKDTRIKFKNEILDIAVRLKQRNTTFFTYNNVLNN